MCVFFAVLFCVPIGIQHTQDYSINSINTVFVTTLHRFTRIDDIKTMLRRRIYRTCDTFIHSYLTIHYCYFSHLRLADCVCMLKALLRLLLAFVVRYLAGGAT